MTEQTPPTGEPTTTPAEGVATGTDQGATPPPVPPDDTAVGQTPPPPPAKKSRKGLLIGLVAGLLVLVLVGSALAVFLVTRGPDKHSIKVTSTAGGMKRDTAGEKSLKQQLDATNQQFETQFKNTAVTSALYKQEDTKRGPKGQLLFLGFKFKTPSEKNPTNFVKKLREVAKANQLTVSNVSAGQEGGKAVCLSTPSKSAQKNAICLWVTRDTAGGLFPNTVGYDSKQLSKLMIDLRGDVETTE